MKHSWSTTLAIATLVAASAGCVKSSVYTTSRLNVPVMIGPVKTLQGKPADGGKVATQVGTEIVNFFFVSSRTHNDAVGNQYTTTTAAWKKQGSSHFDHAFGDALMTCQTCTPKTNRINVGAYDMYLIFTIMEKNWAGLEGQLTGW